LGDIGEYDWLHVIVLRGNTYNGARHNRQNFWDVVVSLRGKGGTGLAKYKGLRLEIEPPDLELRYDQRLSSEELTLIFFFWINLVNKDYSHSLLKPYLGGGGEGI